jgi:hypothetical protein
MKVLVPSSDHGYVEVVVRKMKVVFNKKYRSYSEYMGDEYLEDGDEVVEREVAE